MKFVSKTKVEVLYLETEDGEEYRTDVNGDSWEKLYGESWEPVVWYADEARCKKALGEYHGHV